MNKGCFSKRTRPRKCLPGAAVAVAEEVSQEPDKEVGEKIWCTTYRNTEKTAHELTSLHECHYQTIHKHACTVTYLLTIEYTCRTVGVCQIT